MRFGIVIVLSLFFSLKASGQPYFVDDTGQYFFIVGQEMDDSLSFADQDQFENLINERLENLKALIHKPSELFETTNQEKKGMISARRLISGCIIFACAIGGASGALIGLEHLLSVTTPPTSWALNLGKLGIFAAAGMISGSMASGFLMSVSQSTKPKLQGVSKSFQSRGQRILEKAEELGKNMVRVIWPGPLMNSANVKAFTRNYVFFRYLESLVNTEFHLAQSELDQLSHDQGFKAFTSDMSIESEAELELVGDYAKLVRQLRELELRILKQSLYNFQMDAPLELYTPRNDRADTIHCFETLAMLR